MIRPQRGLRRGNRDVFTYDEIAAVPLFSTLDAADLAALGRSSADIRLKTGDYAVHEGEAPAFFGMIEVTKVIDGAERPIGKRAPGQIFGEVPIVYGTPFQGSFRAVAPSRVMRIDARQYKALAAASSELADSVAAQARERIGGLQNLMAGAHGAQVVMVGHRWDTDCLELRRFLARNQIIFDWLTPDAADLPVRWGGAPPADGDCPAVRLADGTVLAKPQPRVLAERLGLQTCARLEEYDTVIIGGGPAGLAAAVYGASEGLRTIVIEREAPGGQAGTSSRIENYLGFPSGITGDELASRALRQARRLGAEILITRRIVGMDPKARTIRLDDGDVLKARTVILATGVSWRRLGIPGFDRLIGKGVYYGAARSEAGMTQGQDIHLIGAGNSAGQAAMFFANHARTVTLLVRGDSLAKSMSQYLVDQVESKANIRVALHAEVQGIRGAEALAAVEIVDRRTGEVRHEGSGALFVFIGADAETDWLPPELARDRRGYVLTGSELAKTGLWTEERDPYLLETSVPGTFACGDVRFSPVKRVASAVGEGSMAIAFVHQFLQHQASQGPVGR
jgi:thioredoxin reductase (NADPH)